MVERLQPGPERKLGIKNDVTTAGLEKIHSEIIKLMAKTTEINPKTMWFQVAVASGLIGIMATVTISIFNLDKRKPLGSF